MRTPKQRKRLTKLRVDEVSVVDKPANGKRFLILKNEPRGGATPATPAVAARIISETIAAALAPVAERLTAIEVARQIRSGSRPGHQVRKADGSFSWEGSGLIN